MSPDTQQPTGPSALTEEPSADLTEVLRRLDLMDRKIDWIARRFSLGDAPVTSLKVSPSPKAPVDTVEKPPAGTRPKAPADARWAAPVTAPADPAAQPVTVPRAPAAAPFASPLTPVPAADPFAAPGASARALPQPARPGPVAASQPAPSLASAEPTRWERSRSEGNIGRYLLSGAAALLVLLAAVTLIALVWDSIPDGLKVLALGAVSIALVVGGTMLGENRPRQAVTAATLTGTGGALGFVTVIGAVLLGIGLPSAGAFALMTVWGVVLLLVSRMTTQGFTSVISSLGGLVTVGFSTYQVRAGASDVVQTWVMVDLLLVILALTSTALLRTRGKAAALVRPAMPVAVGAVFMAPLEALTSLSPLTGVLLMLVPPIVLYAEVIDDALAPNRWRLPASAGVAGAGFATLIVSVQLMSLPGSPWRAQDGHTLGLAALLVLLAAVSVALLLMKNVPGTWRRAAVIGHLATIVVLSVVTVFSAPVLCPLIVLALVLGCLTAVTESVAVSVALPTATMLPVVFLSPALPSAERLSCLTALLAAIAAAPLLEARLSTVPVRVPTGPTMSSPSVPAFGAPAAPGTADTPALSPLAQAEAQRQQVLVASTWVQVAALVMVVPALVRGWLVGDPRISVPWLLAGALTAALVLAGLFRRSVSPLELVRGRALTGAVPHSPAPTTLAWAGLVLPGVVSLTQLPWTGATGLAWDAAHVMMALALAVLAARAVRPWIRQTEPLMASSVLLTFVTWASVLILADASIDTVLMTITILVTGSVCIVIGFRARLTMLRHYGLGLVLISVLKLALLDIGDQSSITRVLALLVAGLVCFGLSLAYNKVANDAGAGGPAVGQVPVGAPGQPAMVAGPRPAQAQPGTHHGDPRVQPPAQPQSPAQPPQTPGAQPTGQQPSAYGITPDHTRWQPPQS